MTVPNPITSFADCGFPDYLMTDTEVRNAGFVEPTDPSPGLLHRPSGVDMVGIAQTGSGKTLGYLLPDIIH